MTRGYSGDTITWIEIPVTVYYTKHPSTGDGRNEQMHPAYVRVDDIELPADVKKWILSNRIGDIQSAAEDECEGVARYRKGGAG